MRKEIKSMKRRRITALISSVMIAASATFVTAFASSAVSKDFYYSNNIDAYVHGYVDFLEGSFIFEDKVWCNVSLNGPDRACVSAYYTLETNKKVVEKCELSYRNLGDSYIERKVGYGGSYAKLTVLYDGKKGILKTK